MSNTKMKTSSVLSKGPGSILRDAAGPTHLQQIIAALTEGVIIVDPNGSFSWADETALRLHGVRSLKELGGTAGGFAERYQLAYRNAARLRPDEYPIQRLLKGETIDKALVEVKRRSDGKRWFHEIRTMVLNDPAGQPDCLVLILNDETERFNAEERFERAFAANPAPAIIARLSDMRYVKVNHGFLELTGYHRDALIGHSMHEIDVLRGAERRDLAIARLNDRETIPQMEGSLLLPDGREKTVLLGGQPLEIGDAACMLFTFADLHPRQQAQDALRQSEERFAKAFRMAPGPMAILTLDGLRILDVNDAFTAATGWRREEVVGRPEAEVEFWGQGAHRDELERQMKHTGHVRSVEIELRSKDGIRCDYLLSAEMVEIHHERCVLSVMLDITERKQTETELLAAVQSVMQDTSWLGQKIVEKLANVTQGKRSSSKQPELTTLPARAVEVLGFVAQGLSDGEIAKKLGIAQNTVRNHVSAIYGKLGVHRRSAVIVWARERGLGTLPQTPGKMSKSGRKIKAS
jgi:PAS domain S-box-containing protein